MISTIGERIRTVRKSNKLSQVEFANMVGVSQGTLSELEQDKYKPSLDTIIAMKEWFKIDMDWLIFGDENKETKNIFNLSIESQELNLLSYFRKLNEKDKDEIIQLIKLKISRY
ncbi:HTH-type transcriptional regulator Xre [compost metagenome]